MKPLICTNYILKQLTWSTLFITLVLTLVVWLAQSLRFVDFVLHKGFHLSTLFYLIAFLVPDLIGVILPIGFFIACLFIGHKSLLDNEITVMSASGFSQTQLLQAPVILSVMIALFLYVLNLYIMPFSFRQFKDIEHQIRQKSFTFLIQSGCFHSTKNITLYAQDVLQDRTLKGLLIYDQRNREVPTILTAQKGFLDMKSNRLRLHLLKGNHQQLETNGKSVRIIYFDQYTLKFPPLPSMSMRLREDRKLYEEYIEDLFFSQAKNPQKVLKMKVEGYKRLLSPLLTFSFSMLAFAFLLGRRVQKHKHVRGLSYAVVAAFGVQMTFLGLINAADKNLGPVWGAACLLFLSVIIPLKILIFPSPLRKG